MLKPSSFKSKKNYEELILELATSPHKLKKIKIKLEANRLTKALFDTEKFTNDLENGYQKAYQNYFDGNNPHNIRVINSEFKKHTKLNTHR